MGRLPYDKQYELAYQIYEALCAQHPDRLVALSPTRAVFQKRAASGVSNAATQRREKANVNGKRVFMRKTLPCERFSNELYTWLHASCAVLDTQSKMMCATPIVGAVMDIVVWLRSLGLEGI